MDETANALDALLFQRLTSAPDRALAFKNELRPIVRALVAEQLPVVLAGALPALLRQIDSALADNLFRVQAALAAENPDPSVPETAPPAPNTTRADLPQQK